MMMLLVLGLLIVPVCGAESEAEAVLEGVPQEAQAFMPDAGSSPGSGCLRRGVGGCHFVRRIPGGR